MRLNYNAVLAWLESSAVDCTTEQINKMIGVLLEAEDKAKGREAACKHALAQALELAKKAGFDSIEALLRAANPGQPQPATAATVSDKPVAIPRRPYLDPLDPNPTQAWAVFANRPAHTPDWIKTRLAEGWSLSELHYKNHHSAMKARNMKPLYDAVQKHAELLAQEQPRYKRR